MANQRPSLVFKRHSGSSLLLLFALSSVPCLQPRLCTLSRAAEVAAHLSRAEQAYAAQNWKVAAKEYSEVTKLDPSNAAAFARLGMVYQRLGNLKEARASLNPTFQGAEQALAEFQKELAINPRDVPTNSQIGEIDLKLRHINDAVQHFSQAIRLQPSYVDARIGLGKAFLEQKQFQRAAEQFNQAVRLAPNNQNAYYELMIAYRVIGRNDEAKLVLASFLRLRKQAEQQQAYTLKQLQAPLVESSHPAAL